MKKVVYKTTHQIKRIVSLSRRVKQAVKTRFSVARDFEFSVDSPRKRLINKRQVRVEGWIFSKKNSPFQLRVNNNGKLHKVETGIKRLDVVKTYPEYGKERVLHSGFFAEFSYEDGELKIEVDTGGGFRELYATKVAYGLGDLPKDIYNKDLSNNYPEHVNLINNRKDYYYEEALGVHYKRSPRDPRLVAIYLPQFHPIKENDDNWGKGFTEWTNVTKGQPRFVGHQQPILPKDLGFYDLRLESKIHEQIELAKKYGIYGFSFYYYWFSGKKVLDLPLNTFLKHKEWDFNFSICWANENWTKRWDGRHNDIIVAQEYKDDDPIKFIKHVEPILLDKRYITEGGKPVLSVYRPTELKDPKKYADIWREYFREKHGKELHLVAYLSFDDQDPREYGFDAALDFAPLSAFFKNHLFEDSQFPYIDVRRKLLDVNFNGIVADYRTIALNKKLRNAYDFPTYSCVTPSWDNEARKKGQGFVYQNSNPDLYAEWLDGVLEQDTENREDPLIFVNAWNEWAEGAIMEPTDHLGHAILNRTVEKISKYSQGNESVLEYGLVRSKNKKLAVVVHLYYEDLWEDIIEKLRNISVPYDIFISLGKHNHGFQPTGLPKSTKVYTYILPNRGRDVLPFVYVLRRVKAANYTYLLKLHSKKSKHRKDGSSWFGEVLDELLPSQRSVDQVIKLLDKKEVGLVGPSKHLVSLKRHMGANKLLLQHFLTELYGAKVSRDILRSTERYPYIGGTMFWSRVDALDPILNLNLMPDDFQSEHGQVDGTTAHAIERLIGICVKSEDRKTYLMNDQQIFEVEDKSYSGKYKHAP